MNQEEFQKRYEDESDKTYSALSKLDEDELLGIFADPKGGPYKIWTGNDNYVIWRVIKEKGSPKFIKPLFDIVSNLKNEYLIRYHACNALFSIAHIQDDNLKAGVQYGLNANRERVDQQAAIATLAKMLDGLVT